MIYNHILKGGYHSYLKFYFIKEYDKLVYQVCNICGMYHANKPKQCDRCGSQDFEKVVSNDKQFNEIMDIAIQLFHERNKNNN